MSDLSEIYTEQEADALLAIYERDKMGTLSIKGAIPSLPQCFIDRTAKVGKNVWVWHGARVLADAVLGDEVMIGGGTEIGRGSQIGDHSRIGAGTFLPSNSFIGCHVFIGPNVTFTDDRFPRVPDPSDPPYNAEPPFVGDHASIGAGAVILPGIKIGEYARVAAGSVVTRNVPAGHMVVGVPAQERERPVAWT